MTDEFMECDTCRRKHGSPTLCSGCLHNRSHILRLQTALKIATDEARDWHDDYTSMPSLFYSYCIEAADKRLGGIHD
jgi:hypothetical protein